MENNLSNKENWGCYQTYFPE